MDNARTSFWQRYFLVLILPSSASPYQSWLLDNGPFSDHCAIPCQPCMLQIRLCRSDLIRSKHRVNGRYAAKIPVSPLCARYRVRQMHMNNLAHNSHKITQNIPYNHYLECFYFQNAEKQSQKHVPQPPQITGTNKTPTCHINTRQKP